MDTKFSGSAHYVASQDLMETVNIAVALQKPLLIKGEPGTGKTMLAQAVAEALGRKLIIWNVKSTTKAQDGLYVYDVVQRLYDSQFGGQGVDDIKKYIKLGKLGEAFSAEEQVVLLIDEIDKADLEFPNDLLWELDRMEFYIPETKEIVKAKQRPIVIITSNAEKELPDAFLRRCVFHYIEFPDQAQMEAILRVHFEDLDHSIPEDCDLLLINDPTRDLAADELEDILEYLAAGGQVIYNMAGEDLSLPNLETLCATYGMDVAPGLIADTQRYYQNNPYWFFPLVDNSVDSASGISNDATLLFCASRGFTLTDPARESITVKSFLTTSEEGMAVTGDSAKDQTPGTYVVAATATEEIDDGITGRLTVFGSDSLINDAINSTFTNLDNLTLFTSAVTVDFDGISSLSIEPVSLETPTNTISTGGIWALLLIFLIPGALLIYGFIRWLRRQKL